MENEIYLCSSCRRTFISDRSDEEAIAESKGLWGEMSKEDLTVVCDDCFKKIMSI